MAAPFIESSPVTLFTYSAFGLQISSALELPELISGVAPFDVQVSFGPVPEQLSGAALRGVWYQVLPDQFLLDVPGSGRYLVRDGNSITIEPAPGATDAQLRLYLLGSAFGALLHQRGALPIHGSSIETPRGAVIFTGPSGRGKSTLAWEFHRRGYRHLSDDVSVVGFDENGKPRVYPAYPQLSLWADVFDKQGQSHDALQTVHPDLQKFALPTRAHFDPTPAPLHAVYILQTTNTETFEIQPIKGLEKLQILIANTYRPRFVAGMGKRTAHFQLATTAGQFILTRRVTRPVEPFQLKQLADLVEKDLGL